MWPEHNLIITLHSRPAHVAPLVWSMYHVCMENYILLIGHYSFCRFWSLSVYLFFHAFFFACKKSSYYDTFLSKYQELAKLRNWKQPLLSKFFLDILLLKQKLNPEANSWSSWCSCTVVFGANIRRWRDTSYRKWCFHRCSCIPIWFHPN